jgi:transcriptional regulator with XRE-family HTH domain
MSDDAQNPEGPRAKAWRKGAGLSRSRLSELTGYGQSTIAAIERGQWARGTMVDDATMQAYRLACAAVALGVRFDWGEIELRPFEAVIRIPAEAQAPRVPRPPEARPLRFEDPDAVED